MSELIIEDISRKFGQTIALDRTSISVPSGSFVALLGPSGCGKTTTLRIVAGFDQPNSGDIRVDGRSVLALPPNKRRLGMMFQDYSLFPHMTIGQNVAFGLRMMKTPREEMAKRVRYALDLVRLPHVADRYPSQLSGGQKQRIALARSLVVNPNVLLLDEPLAALDKNLRESMQFELKNIQATLGITTVMVTHDQEEALTLADQVVVMNNGRVMQRGNPNEVYERPANAFVSEFLGTANLFVGTLSIEGEDAILSVRSEGRPDVRLAAPRGSLPSSGFCVGVRPEKIRLSTEEPSSQNKLPCTVIGHVFRGSGNAYELSHDGLSTPLIAYRQSDTISGSRIYSKGENVWASWETESAFTFPTDG